MVHPALLRTSTASGSAAGWLPAAAGRSEWSPLDLVKALLRRWNLRMVSGYRPERHYMRGGRTAGAKSLAAG